LQCVRGFRAGVAAGRRWRRDARPGRRTDAHRSAAKPAVTAVQRPHRADRLVGVRHWPRPHAASTDSAGEPIPAWFGWTVTVCDAIGLGALTVVGVMVAMLTRSEPLLLWGP